MPDIDQDRKRVPDHRSDLLKGSLPQGPPVHPRSRNMEDLRVEMKQLREVWRSCAGDNVDADESYFVLNLAADW